MSKCKKILRKVIVLLLAVVLVVIDIPISHHMEVKASSDSNIASISYQSGEEAISFEPSTSEDNVKGVNVSTETQVAITITYDSATFDKDTVTPTIQAAEGEAANLEVDNNNDVLSSTTIIELDTLYTINAGGSSVTIKLVVDTEAPAIGDITNAEGSKYDAEKIVVAEDTIVRIYVTDANYGYLKIDDNDDSTETEVVDTINTQEIEGTTYYYYEYTVSNKGEYIFVAVDSAGNKSESKTIYVDTHGPGITKIIDASSTEESEIKYSDEDVNYINAETVSLKIYVSDDLSKVKSVKYDEQTNTNLIDDAYFLCENVSVGEKTFTLKDDKGNTAEYTYSFAQTTMPSISGIYEKNSNGEFSEVKTSCNYTENGNYTVYIEVEHGNSTEKINEVRYSTGNDFNTATSVTVTDNGKYVVSLTGIDEEVTYNFWARDANNNISTPVAVTFAKDDTNISISSVNVTSKTQGWIFKKTTYRIDVSFTEVDSGIKSVTAKCGDTNKDVNIDEEKGTYYIDNLTKDEINKEFIFTVTKDIVGSSSQQCSYSSNKTVQITSSNSEWLNSLALSAENYENQVIVFDIATEKNITGISYNIYKYEDETFTYSETISVGEDSTYEIGIGNIIYNNASKFTDGYYLVVIKVNTSDGSFEHNVYVGVDREAPTFTYNDSSYVEDFVNVSEVADLQITNIVEELSGVVDTGAEVGLCDENGEKLANITVNNNTAILKDAISDYMDEKQVTSATYKINIIAADKAGNKGSDTITLNIDNSDVTFDSDIADFVQNEDGSNEWINIENLSDRILTINEFKLGNYTPGNIKVTITSQEDSSKSYTSEEAITADTDSVAVDLSSLGELVLEDGKKYDIEILVTNSKFDSSKSLNENAAYNYMLITGTMGIDTSAPKSEDITISTEYDGEWTRGVISVEINGTDGSGSDITYYYYLSGTDVAAPENTVIRNANKVVQLNEGVGEISVDYAGEYYLYFCAEDEAGNISDVIRLEKASEDGSDNIPYVIRYDNTKPHAEVKVVEGDYRGIFGNTKWYKGNVTVEYSMWNDYSSIKEDITEGSLINKKLETSLIVNGYIYNETTKKYIATRDTNREGIWNTTFIAYNEVGNRLESDELTFGVDLYPPKFNNDLSISGNSTIDKVHVSNSKIDIKGSVADGEGSGIAKIELVDASGKTVKSVTDTNDYKFTIKECGEYKGYKIKATDNVGHETYSAPFDMLIAEKDTSITEVYAEGYESIGNEKWYGKNTNISFNVVNKNKAGLESVTITINGKEVFKKTDISKDKKVTNLSNTVCKVNTKDVTINSEDNSYKVMVTAVDNAGNTTEKTVTIYKDTKKPTLAGFKFGDVEGVYNTNYGYFFTKDTKVTVTVSDQTPGSGLKSISMYTVDKDGKTSTAITKNTTNGTAEFIIKAGFKGQIYVYGTDKVGNAGTEKALAGTIIETEALHKEHSDISFKLEETPYKDKDGNPLYKSESVPVTIKIKDTFSGIKEVTWKVTSEDSNAEEISGSATIDAEGNVSGEIDKNGNNDLNLVTEVTKKLNINHNSNNIRITVVMTDNAGHKLKKTYRLSIDNTAPIVNVTYNNVAPDNNNIFNADRIATITVTERNFDSSDIKLDIENTEEFIPQLTVWEEIEGSLANGDDTRYRATVAFTEDGDYTFGISYSDLAKNVATVNYANAVSPNEFTIDKTRPVITVTYDNNAVANGNYYQDGRTATISINEHNFDAGRVEITVRENGKETNRTVTGFNTNGDIHTATLEFNTEAEFIINATCSDGAGNEVQNAVNDTFIIDTEAPTMLVTGVENNKAYNESTVGITVTAADAHFDVLDVVLLQYDSKGEFKQVSLTETDIANGKEYAITNLKDDAIYTLTSTVKDKSGRSLTDVRTFSINRNGSTFAITDAATVKMKNAYINEANDIVIYETNVNKLNMDTISVMIYKNAEAIELVKGQDYELTVEEEEGQWCKYTYTIKKENFLEDATYKVAIYSEDMAENIALSESSDKGAEFGFVVDNTKPICNIYDLKSGTTYGVDSKTVEFMPEDNIELSEVTVVLNGKETYKVSGEELKKLLDTGDNLSFVIESSTGSQNVVIKCKDMAGNELETEIKGFYVTTNLWVQFTTNTTLIIISIVALIVLIGLIIFLIVKKKKKKEK